MDQTSLELYKLIVLHMLDRVDFPLTRSQISDFILEKEYTNYMTLQEVFAELLEGGYLEENTIGNRTLLTLTEEGRQILEFRGHVIGSAIREDVAAFLTQNKLQLKNEVSIQARYYQTTGKEYAADLIAKDNGSTLVSITLTVPTEEIAAGICENWRRNNEEIYQYLIDKLF